MATAPLHQHVVAGLTTRIVSGEWPAGFLLPTEAELAALLGVSRTVVREGMRLLVDRGLVIVRQGKGTIAAARTRWNMLEPHVLSEGLRHGVAEVASHVVEARHLLEPVIAGLAAKRITPAQIAALETVLRDIEHTAGNPEQVSDLGVRFHELIAEAAGNPLLMQMLAPIYAAIRLWQETPRQPPEMLRASRQEHHQIVDALRAGDPPQAREAAAHHLHHTFETGVRAAAGRVRRTTPVASMSG